MSLERRRYTLVVDLFVDAERFDPSDVPDEIVAIEDFVSDELKGTVVDMMLGDVRDAVEEQA